MRAGGVLVNLTGWWAVTDLGAVPPVPIAFFEAPSDAKAFRAKCLLMEPGHRFALDEVEDHAHT